MDMILLTREKFHFKVRGKTFSRSWLFSGPRFNIQAAYFDLVMLADDKAQINATIKELQARWRVTRQTAFMWIVSLEAHGYVKYEYNYENKVFEVTIMDPDSNRIM